MLKKSRVTFECVYFQKSRNLSNLERISLLQEQVAVTLLDPRNMPDLNCIPVHQHDQAWALCALWSLPRLMRSRIQMRQLTSTTQSKLSMTSWSRLPPAPVNSIDLLSAEMIADREIKIWQTRTVPFPKDKNPLDEWRRGVVYLFP